MSSNWTGPEVNNFRDYLRIASVHPDINYADCVTFLRKQATELNLPIVLIEKNPLKPIVIITWAGTSPSLPSILLNSHMDVVPVFPDSWTYPPFDAHLTEDGKIYARGSQDMKCVAIQYIEAIRRLKNAGTRLKRTIHMCFVPDEEVGGVDGMKEFVHTQEFKNLNVGLAIDEGMASPTEDFLLYYGERSIWHLIIKCVGNPGHGSLILPNTAGEKMRVVIDRFMDFRQKEKERLEQDDSLTVGDVTTVNLTMASGGVQTNVVPESLTVVFDVRLATDVDHAEFEQMVISWCNEAGEDVTIEYEQKEDNVGNTALDNTNPYWVAFKKAADDLNIKLLTRIFPGGTDSRFVRGVGLPAFGFSPMNKTPVLLHDHDEYLHADIFLEGIKIYEKLITGVANVD